VVPENTTFVMEVNGTDPDGDALLYRIAYGDDWNRFALNATSGVLVFVVPPDFENPSDDDANNVYELTVQVTDGEFSATKNLAITVTDVHEKEPPVVREHGAIEGDFDIFIPDLKPEDLRLNLPFKSHFRLKLEMAPKNKNREFNANFTWIIDNEKIKLASDSQIVVTLLEGEHVIELQAKKGASTYFKRKKLRLEMVNDKPSWKWLK
jgi:hypothetical protein